MYVFYVCLYCVAIVADDHPHFSSHGWACETSASVYKSVDVNLSLSPFCLLNDTLY